MVSKSDVSGVYDVTANEGYQMLAGFSSLVSAGTGTVPTHYGGFGTRYRYLASDRVLNSFVGKTRASLFEKARSRRGPTVGLRGANSW